MFEENSQGQLDSVHNPFSAPVADDKEKLMTLSTDNKEELLKIMTRGYDLVLNGSEIGGGAIRINDVEMQNKVFSVLGMSEQEVEDNFG